MSDEDTTVWFNPSCSKCRGARDLLAEQGVDASFVEYLKDAPTREELERVLGLLGFDDPRAMMRTGESVYAELELAHVTDRSALLDAMAEHPILIERPIMVRGERAVVGRPPETVQEIL